MIFLEMTLLVIKHIFYYYLDDDVLAFVLRSHGDGTEWRIIHNANKNNILETFFNQTNRI